ncbi:phage tail tape measure protein [Sphingobacteriaceae bacterium WQ 2009]|uniref:Phage tail tape measure protein n=1 Tax=Rhinopithecimicrobium faecis TaxID=2820698 RepID=A0A8T4HDP1_9SPHI|nr:phage tail tape measure protein [Sphingobacteriaceae bacterium WQ 2009]
MGKKLTQEDLVLNIIVNGNKAKSEIGQLGRNIQDTKVKLSAAQEEMKKLDRQGQSNSTRYQELSRQVQQYNATITDSKKRLAELNQSMKLEDQSIKQLETSLKRLKNLRKESAPNSDQYAEYSKQITAVTGRLRELQVGTEQTGNVLSNMGSNLNKYIGIAVAAGASFIAFWSGVKGATDEYAKFDDILSDVMKTTNLNKDAVKELNAELETLQTRTSQEDLLGLSRIAGKLGYTEIAEISEFVRANNEIVVALNDDLGGNVEETVNIIGKLVDIFKLKDMYSTEDAFRKVGSAINELGMASTANEGYMVEFARRMAGVAPLAGITIEQILGLGATLDQLGQSEEVASTALSKLFVKMASDASTFAKYAGMSITDFKKLLEDDFMLAFTRVLQGVKDNSAGINELAATLGDLGEDSGRVIGVLGTMANNVDVLTGSIALSNKAMQDGTSITTEYNIKNENAAAKLEMAQKEAAKFRRELGEKLWPIMTTGNSLLTIFYQVLATAITFIASNIKLISVLAITLSVYTLSVNAATLAEYAKAKATAIATAATRLFNAAIAANPLGLFLTALVGVASALLIYRDHSQDAQLATKELSGSMKEAKKDYERQTQAIERNLAAALDKTKSDGLRLAAIKNLRDAMPGVLQDYSDEAIMAGKATAAIKDQIKQLITLSTVRAYQSKMEKLSAQKLDLNDQLERGYQGAGFSDKLSIMPEIIFSSNYEKSYQEAVKKRIGAIEKAQAMIGNKALEEQAKLNASLVALPSTNIPNNKVTLMDADKPKKDAGIQKVQDRIAVEIDSWKKMNTIQNDGMDKQLIDLDAKYAEFLKITTHHESKRAEVAEIYTTLKLKRLHELDEQAAKDYLAQKKQEFESSSQLIRSQAEAEYQFKLQQIDLQNTTEEEKFLQKTLLEEDYRLQQFNQQQQDLVAKALLLTQFEESGNLEIEQVKQIAEEKAKIQKDYVNNQIAESQRESAKRLEIERNTNEALYQLKADTVKAYENAFSIIGGFFSENAKIANIFLVLEKAAAAASVIVNLQKEIAGYYAANALLGPAGAVIASTMAGAAKIRAGISLATIAATTIQGISSNNKKSKDKSSTTVSGRESGGYFSVTREQDGRKFRAQSNPGKRGFINRPTVLVGENGNEWVANASVVNNPELRPIIDVLDIAQKNGHISSLTLREVLAQANGRIAGRENGGFFKQSKNNVATQAPSFEELALILKSQSALVEKLTNQLDKGITAEVSLLGKGGFIEKQKELASIQSNANL